MLSNIRNALVSEQAKQFYATAGGAIAGLTTQVALDRGFFNAPEATHVMDDIGYAALPVLGATVGLLAHYSRLGAGAAGNKAKQVGLSVLSIAGAAAGLIVSGRAYPNVKLSTDGVVNGLVGGLLSAVTTPFCTYLTAKPLINSLSHQGNPDVYTRAPY